LRLSIIAKPHNGWLNRKKPDYNKKVNLPEDPASAWLFTSASWSSNLQQKIHHRQQYLWIRCNNKTSIV